MKLISIPYCLISYHISKYEHLLFKLLLLVVVVAVITGKISNLINKPIGPRNFANIILVLNEAKYRKWRRQ
jgi:ABC-type enterochelin transport system permease subunit